MFGAELFVIRPSVRFGKQAVEQQVEIGLQEGLLVGSGHAAVVEYQPQNCCRQDGRDHDFGEFHRNFAKLPRRHTLENESVDLGDDRLNELIVVAVDQVGEPVSFGNDEPRQLAGRAILGDLS